MDSISRGNITEADLRHAFSRSEIDEILESPEDAAVGVETQFAAPVVFGPVAFQATSVNQRCIHVLGIFAEYRRD
ncbi:MAG: hypothetical protein GY866_36480 [Proteobacteria bacterium]|nr:hypothetical protein [Pseudomonadota bacterium]